MIFKTTIRSTKIFAAFIIVLVASCKSSQKASQTPTLDPPLDTERTLLWQVSGNNLTTPSYLFGTIHVISSDDFFLGDNVIKKFNASHQLILEMDLANINPLEIAQASVLPDGKSIKDYYTEEEYIEVESYFADSLGAPLSLFKTAYSKLKPFFLQQFVYLQYLGNNTSSYEMEFMDMAKVQNIELSGLETLTEQLAIVDQMSIEDQYESFLKTVREGYQQAGYLDELIEVYKSKDIQKLYEMIMDYDEIQDISYILVDDRNKKWIEQLVTAFENNTAFVAVGAGHLGGPVGLIQLLRDQGYTVDPISMD